MSAPSEEDSVRDDSARRRYEMTVEGQAVFADYRLHGDILHILHVEAPPALRGTGAAGRFMRALMEEMRRRKLSVLPVCGYAAAWLARHGEYRDLMVR